MDILSKGKDSALSILDTIHKKKLVRRYFILIVSLFISACYFNLLQLPTQIVTGGTSGVAIILNSYFNVSPSTVVFLFSIVLLIAGFIFLGIEKSSGAVVTAIIYPIFLDLTANIGNYIQVDLSDKILVSIFVGILSGVTSGMVYKVGFCKGGLSIVGVISCK